ncbi:hypothetical protein PSTEL_21255 [Paenibacillus stellifer]|uniref:ABC transporter domain-containing protein n=1 Tax=Paenibacillus stellifer TaxID=169760 RepID=A0A089LWH5_9BACL|nr:hypothetical protein PSTEL_21255 [Paenibacillus stellifer]
MFDQGAFGYEERRPVLQNLSLNIRAGETIAFVGPSGAGKTTVCSLLPRFYEVTGGGIAIDGTDIRRFKLESLRRQIGIVQQDVFLFSGTIRENIAYGKLDAGIDEIWAAARRVHLEELIQSLPEGMDTVIGERGVKLSGGQKQRKRKAATMRPARPAGALMQRPRPSLSSSGRRGLDSSAEGKRNPPPVMRSDQ